MAQFDVYHNSNPESHRKIPYLLDVQSDLLDLISTRVVVPLVKKAKIKRSVKHLMPEFIVNDAHLVMSTPELAAVNIRMLAYHRRLALKSRSDEAQQT